MRVMMIMALAVMLVPIGSAQEGARPSVENATFYGHVDCDASAYGISVVAQSAGTNCGTGEGTSHTWELPEDPPLDVELVLDEGGDVPMTVWLGSNTHGGNVDITSTIYSGDTVVAEGSGSATYLGAAGETYQEVTMTGTALVAQVTEPLRWEVTADGAFSSIFMRFEEGRWSQFTLPIIEVLGAPAPAPGLQFHDLDGEEAAAAITLNGTEQHQYNWSAPAGPFAMFLQGQVDNGTASVEVVDGANATIFSTEFEAGPINVTQSLNGTVGPWRILVNSTDAQGNMSLLITREDHQPGDHDSDDPTGHDGEDDDPTGNETEDQDSPGVGWLALVAVAAIALLRRR